MGIEILMNHLSYFLELTSKEDFKPKSFPYKNGEIKKASYNSGKFCKFLWDEVGKGYWLERSDWTIDHWNKWINRNYVLFYIAYLDSNPMGFFELSKDKTDIKIEGLGLLPVFIGKGLGGGLLSAATEKAFKWGAKRIWLHTATDDHPAALPNYQKRGFKIFKEENLKDPMPKNLI